MEKSLKPPNKRKVKQQYHFGDIYFVSNGMFLHFNYQSVGGRGEEVEIKEDKTKYLITFDPSLFSKLN